VKRLHLFALLLVLLLVLAGCGASRTDQAKSAEPGSDNSAGAPSYDAIAPEEPLPGPGKPDGSYGEAKQKLIRTAEIVLDVENIEVVLGDIRQLARVAGGFIAESSISGQLENRRAWLTLRVPAAKLEQVLSDIEVTGKRIELRTGDQDVTLQYVDLEARIRNAERQEERLLEILEKAETVEDILRVEQELSRIRGQLESMTAEFRYLSDRVDYATISVTLRETATASPTITGSGLKGVWQRGVAGLVNSINSMLTGLGSFLVFFLTAIPYFVFLTVIAIPGIFILRKLFNNRPRTPDA
jgi:TolA-binding protein